VGVTAQSEVLAARGVYVSFEGLTALDNVDMELRRGEILGLIGPNGAGKTTLVNVISGFQRPDRGAVSLDSHNVTRWSPHRIGRAGLVRTFQSARLFGGLSVLENVELGGLGVGRSRRAARRRAHGILDWLDIGQHASVPADSLPFGVERRIGIARALAMEPRFLLMDEPAAGLDERETDALVHTVSRIRDEFRCGILVIEHNMRLIMKLCERIQVLDQGATIADGLPEDVQANDRVRQAYLGGVAKA